MRVVHRLVGLYAAIGVIWLALTGVLLQLSVPLRWDRTPLPDGLMALVYPTAVAASQGSFVAGPHELTGSAQGWRFDAVPIGDPPGAPLALLPGGGLWFAIGERGAVLLDAGGNLVERLSWAAVGLGRPMAVAALDDRACVRDDRRREACSADGVEWSEPGGEASRQPPSVSPRTPGWRPLSAVAHDAAGRAVGTRPGGAPDGREGAAGARPLPTWERLFQDLHALRFAGPAAVWLGVGFGLAALTLVLTGLWSYLRGVRYWREAQRGDR